MSNLPQLNVFKNNKLNNIGAQIIENYKKTNDYGNLVHKLYKKAIIKRWETGKLLYENYDEIIEECSTQRQFAEKLGITESMLSNDKRAYKSLLDEGCKEKEEFLELLENKGIKKTTYSWERLPKLLNEPDADTKQKDQRPKDEKRLEEIYQELEEIRERNESENQNHIKSKAVEIEDRVQDLSKHINKLNPADYIWESKYYREWCKSLGIDMIDRQAASDLEFHHTDIYNAVGGVGQKLPDVMGIPIRADRHRRVEGGSEDLDPIEIADGMITCLSLFIIHHFEK